MGQMYQCPPGARIPVGPNYYHVIPNRAVGAGSSGNDLKTYQEPQPFAWGYYQTFWRGNRLPSSSIYQVAPVYRILRREQFSASRNNGGFDVQLAVGQTVDLIRRMQAAWRLQGNKQVPINVAVGQFSMGR